VVLPTCPLQVEVETDALKLLAAAGCSAEVYEEAWPLTAQSDPGQRCEGWKLLFTSAAVSGDQAHKMQLFQVRGAVQEVAAPLLT